MVFSVRKMCRFERSNLNGLNLDSLFDVVVYENFLLLFLFLKYAFLLIYRLA